MMLIALIAAVVCLAILAVVVVRQRRARRLLEQHCIDPDGLHMLIEAQEKVLIYDVRQPLDLLAYSVIIPGAVRIPPKDLMDNPSLIPQDEDSVLYCTCPGEKTSRAIVEKALAQNLMRLKILKGGLEAWKAKGYPVEPYVQSFHLDTAT